MASVRVEVKWQKEVFKDVEVDLEQPATVFKMQLFSLTGVPPERQKIMGVKGGLLKDDADLAQLGLKPGQKLTMMGTADKVPEAPAAAQTFMEDLPEEEQDTSGEGAGWLGHVALWLKRPDCRGGRSWGGRRAPPAVVQPPKHVPGVNAMQVLCRHGQVRRRPGEPGQHLLPEQHGAVPLRGARAAQQVRVQVQGCSAVQCGALMCPTQQCATEWQMG